MIGRPIPEPLVFGYTDLLPLDGADIQPYRAPQTNLPGARPTANRRSGSWCHPPLGNTVLLLAVWVIVHLQVVPPQQRCPVDPERNRALPDLLLL